MLKGWYPTAFSMPRQPGSQEICKLVELKFKTSALLSVHAAADSGHPRSSKCWRSVPNRLNPGLAIRFDGDTGVVHTPSKGHTGHFSPELTGSAIPPKAWLSEIEDHANPRPTMMRCGCLLSRSQDYQARQRH